MTHCTCGAVAHIDATRCGPATFVCDSPNGCRATFRVANVTVAYDDGREG